MALVCFEDIKSSSHFNNSVHSLDMVATSPLSRKIHRRDLKTNETPKLSLKMKKTKPDSVMKEYLNEKRNRRIEAGVDLPKGGFIPIDQNYQGSTIIIRAGAPYHSNVSVIINKNDAFKCWLCCSGNDECFDEYWRETILFYSIAYEKTKLAFKDAGVCITFI